MKKILLILLLVGFASCEKTIESFSFSTEKIVGSWVLESVFLGDVVDGVCPFNSKEKPRGINIKFELKDGKINFEGRSVVNTYGGTYEIIDNKLKIKELISTEKGDSKEFMDCEARFYNLLSVANDFKIETVGNTTYLDLGTFPPVGTPPSRAGGGTFLRFYKAE